MTPIRRLGGSGPWTVYAFFDRDGKCLYVGQSRRFFERAIQHSNRSRWWPRVEFYETWQASDHPSMDTLEARTIGRLRPTENKARTGWVNLG